MIISMICIAFFSLGERGGGVKVLPYIVITVSAIFFSMLPLMWAYPAAHVMADQFWVLIYSLLLLCIIFFRLGFAWVRLQFISWK